MAPDPLFSVFGRGVYAYGICIGIGIFACLLVFFFYTNKKKINSSVQNFAFIVAGVAIVLGFLIAKLYQAVYDYIENPALGFDFQGAGMTAMGGFIGGAVVFIAVYFGVGHFLFRGENKGIHIKEFNKIFLVAPICITIAHAFGRVGCLMSGCCHGELLSTEANVTGGIWMRAIDTGVWGSYVPTQLYEALFLFILCAILSLLFFKGCNLTMQIYLIAYGVWRIFIEMLRTDDRGAIVLGLAPSQWQSIIFIVGGLALILIYYLLKKPFFFKDEK